MLFPDAALVMDTSARSGGEQRKSGTQGTAQPRIAAAMFAHFRKDWEAFKASPPGRRFQDVHKRREEAAKGASSGVRRYLLMGAGVALILTGAFFLFVPGPGSLVMLVGIALVASESLLIARALDRLEVLLRPPFLWLRDRWQALNSTQRVVMSAAAAVLGALVSLALYFYVAR